MLKLPQVELSKADKIRLLKSFYNALENTRKIYLNEIQSLAKVLKEWETENNHLVNEFKN